MAGKEKRCPHCGKEMSKCKCEGYDKGSKDKGGKKPGKPGKK